MSATAWLTRMRRAFGRGLPVVLTTCVLALCAAPSVRAQEQQIALETAQLQYGGEGADAGLRLEADFALTLSPVLEEAVNRGIALYFTIEFEVYRERWYWFDRRVVEAALNYRLSYSPLTRQYRLARGTLALPFDSLTEALTAMARVRSWRVAEPGALIPGASYRARLRMRLDTAQLPKPFQVDALTNRDWALASDWRPVAMPMLAER